MHSLADANVLHTAGEAQVFRCRIDRDAKDHVCVGTLRVVVDSKGVHILCIGSLNSPKFTCILPAPFCVLNKAEMTCPGNADGVIVLISLVHAGVSDMDELADILIGCNCVVHQPRYDNSSEVWAKRTRQAGAGISWVIDKASRFAGQGIEKVGETARNNLVPAEKEAEISPEMMKAVEKTKTATQALVKGVDYLIAGAVSGTKYVVSKATRRDSDRGPGDQGTGKTIAESALSATIEVANSISDCKDNLIGCTTSATSKTVGHKYGEQAGTITRDGMEAAGNVADVAFMRKPAKILKEVGKKTALGAAQGLTHGGDGDADTEQSPESEPLHIGEYPRSRTSITI